MIAAILAAQLTMAPPAVAVTYEGVPPEVVRVSVHGWQDGAAPLRGPAPEERQGSRVVVRGLAGHRSLVVLERQDGAYLLDGPFWWPPRDVERVLDRRWRRTISVSASQPLAGATALEFLSAAPGADGQWPRCFAASERRWTCWGAATREPGVFLCRAADRVWWAIVSDGPVAELRASKWGRLLLVRDTTGEPSGLRVRFAHPVPQSSRRPRGLRLDIAAVAAAQSTAVAPWAAWLTGDDVPSEAWIEISTAHAGPVFLDLQDEAAGPLSLPLTRELPETRSLDGVVLSGRDRPAAGALVTLFRLIDPPSSTAASREKPPRRVLVGEAMVDAAGSFRLEGVGEAEYEVVAWHAQMGRASSWLPRAPGVFTIRLESPGTVRGRVVSGGKPRAGVDITSLPAPEAYRDAADLIDVKGGDARTGADGRFEVMVAANGGGELRIGGGALPIKRMSLPRVPAPLLDLGDIELGAPLEFTLVLDRDTACGVRATGPIEQSGLQIVLAARTAPGLFRIVLPEPGLWAFGLVCGREGFALAPPTVRITPAHAGKEVRFSVR